MDQTIFNYIHLNKVLTIATSVNNKPYCANCYYAYDKTSNTLLFLSDETTRHLKESLINNSVAGTIQNGVTTVAKIQGIQFTGDFLVPTDLEQQLFYAIYYNKFPFAKARPSAIWGIKLNWIKMTDNTLGFGTKLFWEREGIS
jgi:uncharacterized protein YhbP (UPF0306 family)